MNSGFLIVKKYAVLYREYADRYAEVPGYYAIPRIDKDPSEFAIQYRGIDRDAIEDYDKSDDLSEIYMAELAGKDLCFDGIIFTEPDARRAFDLLTTPDEYELIYLRIADSGAAAPAGFQSIGFEASYFTGDHFSPSCDCMMFLRWHGTDEEGVVFLPHFQKLNPHGLFNSVTDVKDFLALYESFEWTEVGPYEIVEVFVRR